MKDLDRILKNNGIAPIKKDNPLDDKFNNPMDQLDDLFETFAKIFKPKNPKK